MIHFYFFVRWMRGACLLVMPLSLTLAQTPVITALSPGINAHAAMRTGPITATFNQPLTPTSTSALQVFSSQRGGQRTSTMPAVVNGNTLSFTPSSYPFQPGETVQYTITRAAASSSGALAQPWVGQFTTAVSNTSPGTFQAAGSSAGGYLVDDIVTGDLDGDGDLDMVLAEFVSSTARVRFNNGSGTFTNGQTIPVSADPGQLALGDIDGDGDLDLLSASSAYQTGPNTITVRLNNGSGSFSGTQNVSVGYVAVAVKLADVDGDGDLDLLAANNETGFTIPSSVSIRLNNGSGVFSGTQNVRIGYGISDLAVGDVDGDGDVDLLTVNYNNSQNGILNIQLNDGNGTFTGTPSVLIAADATQLAIGDLDNDGDLDVVTAHLGPNAVNVLANNGSGTFSVTQNIAAGSYSYCVALGDIDGDGDLDLLASNYDSNTVSICLNNGNGLFSGAQSLSVGGYPVTVRPSDVDGDGDLDVVVSNTDDGTIGLYLNTVPAPLPVQLTAFTARLTGSTIVQLTWATASELNSTRFEVERSQDGINFGTIGQVAAAGSTTTPHTYGLVDASLPMGADLLYYRLRQVDADSKASYSPVRSVTLPASTSLTLYPNPATGLVTLRGTAPGVLVQVLDLLGRVSATVTTDATGTASLSGLAPGLYLVRTGTTTARLTVE